MLVRLRSMEMHETHAWMHVCTYGYAYTVHMTMTTMGTV